MPPLHNSLTAVTEYIIKNPPPKSFPFNSLPHHSSPLLQHACAYHSSLIVKAQTLKAVN